MPILKTLKSKKMLEVQDAEYRNQMSCCSCLRPNYALIDEDSEYRTRRNNKWIITAVLGIVTEFMTGVAIWGVFGSSFANSPYINAAKGVFIFLFVLCLLCNSILVGLVIFECYHYWRRPIQV